MTDLVVRKMPFEFDATVPFLWQPANPSFSVFCNVFMSSVLTAELRFRGPGGGRRRVRAGSPRTLFEAVPTRQLITMLSRLLLSQTPNHDPADQPLPEWAGTWMDEYERGTGMTSFVGTSANGSPS